MDRGRRRPGGTGSGVEVDQGAGGEVDAPVVAVARLAGGVLGVADAAAAGADDVHEGVLLAVDPDFEQLEGFAGGLALLPQFVAGGAPEDGRAFGNRLLHRGFVGVGDEDDFLGVGVLDRDGDDVGAAGGDFRDLGKVEREGGAFFEFFHGGAVPGWGLGDGGWVSGTYMPFSF